MDNYEINILRRGGNWKKVKPDDLIIDEINNDIDEINNELNHDNELNHKKAHDDFLSYITKVDLIISRLEALEDEKNKLKEELKIFENKFFEKKKLAEDEINKISQEKEMIEKTLNVIKNLKSF